MVSRRSSVAPAFAVSSSTSKSTSNGCARSRSSGFTPMRPRARNPRISMRSGMAGTLSAVRREPAGELDEAAAERVELLAADALDERDRLRPVRHQAGPADVPADQADEPVPELLAVHDDLRAVAEHLVDLGVEGLEVGPGVVGAAEGTVPVCD